jgi:hypothetical protein
LDQLPPGSVVLNFYDVGGWLSWRHPDLNRSIDGTVRPYDPDYVRRYWTAISVDDGWRQFIREIKPRAALLLADSHLVDALKQSGWTVTARSNDYVLLMPPTTPAA